VAAVAASVASGTREKILDSGDSQLIRESLNLDSLVARSHCRGSGPRPRRDRVSASWKE